MYERFTDRARRVVVLAQEEARLLKHNWIGTEHILLGLIHENDGVAARALLGLGISLEPVREKIRNQIGQGEHDPSGHIPLTPRAKKTMELSLRESLQLGHNYIGTEHLLLGLLRESESVAVQILVGLGLDLSVIRQQVIQLLSGYQVPKPVPSQPERLWNYIPFDVAREFIKWIEELDKILGPFDPGHPGKVIADHVREAIQHQGSL